MKIKIDRSIPFDPVTSMSTLLGTLLGEGWTIEEEDERALTLTEVDLDNVQLVISDEFGINGEKWLKKQKEAGYIRLDAKILQALLENKHLIPETWKRRTGNGTILVLFEGTILRTCGRRCVLYLFWRWGEWHCSFCWLDSNGWWDDSLPSAVLVS